MVHYVSAALGKNFNTPNVSKFHENNCINEWRFPQSIEPCPRMFLNTLLKFNIILVI